MARPRKLTLEKISKGTYRKSRYGHVNNNVIPISSIPQCPAYFKDPAREVWKISLEELFEKKVISKIDLPLFEQYCFQYDVLTDAIEDMKNGAVIPIKNNGGGKSMIKNPAFTVYAEAYDRIHKTSQQFGLNPLSRERINIPKTSPDDAAKEKLEFLRSVRR